MTRVTVLLLALLGMAACGDDEPAQPAVDVPSWAKVAPEQIAEAKKHGVPVVFKNDLGMRFVLIPAGTFLMGSPEDEKYRRDDEGQHEATLTKPFYMQTTEVTNEQYRRWPSKSNHKSGPWKDWRDQVRELNLPAQPAAIVNWGDAAAYAMWVGEEDEGRRYALPSEAQWEYACRAGTSTRYFWGRTVSEAARHANGYDQATWEMWGDPSHPVPGDDGYRVSGPVGSYEPNGWGLHDMTGNVHEWCSDWYGEYPSGPVIDPSGPIQGSRRVSRGGNWHCREWGLRVARRFPGPVAQEAGGPVNGFRLVSPLPEPKSGK